MSPNIQNKDSTRMATYDGTFASARFTKKDILRILSVIALDFLPGEYSPKVLETWLNESIETLERMKRLSYSEQN